MAIDLTCGETGSTAEDIINRVNDHDAEIIDNSELINSKANKNLVINGGFDIWQRGSPIVSGAGVGADQWETNLNDTFMEKYYSGTPRIGNYCALTVPSATASGSQRITQIIENAQRLNEKTVTLSFWIYPDSNAATQDHHLHFWRGTEALPFETTIETVPLTLNPSAWQKIEYTLTLPDFDQDGVLSFAIRYNHTNGTLSRCYYSQIQLEIGSEATPFEIRKVGEELALCQRYFWSYKESSPWNVICTAVEGPSAGKSNGLLNLPVEMRTTPTVEYSGLRAVDVAQATKGIDSIAGIGKSALYFTVSSSNSAVITGNGSTIVLFAKAEI